MLLKLGASFDTCLRDVLQQAGRLAFAACVAVVSFPSAAQLSKPLPLLKVLVLKNSPSMSYRNPEGQLVGFNVDLAHSLCKRIRARCEIEETALATVIDQVARGEADFSTASLTPSSERMKKVLFTQPIMNNGKSYWMGRMPMTESARSRVAVVAGSVQHQWAIRAKETRQWTVIGVESNADVSKAMLGGQADAGLFPFATTLSLVHEGRLGAAGFSVLEPIDGLPSSRKTAIAVNPRKPELLGALNEALQHMKVSGELDELNSKHLPMRML